MCEGNSCIVTRESESWKISSVQSLSHVRLYATPWTAARQASLSITNSWNLLKLMSIRSVMPSNHLILCHPLLLLPSVFPRIRVFLNELVLCIMWPKYWSFSFSISPSLGLISLRIDWFDLLVVQGTLKSLLQHHSWKASILRLSAFFIVQLSHPYMIIGKIKLKNRCNYFQNQNMWKLKCISNPCDIGPLNFIFLYGTLDEFVCHLCARAMLIFSVSFQF